MGFQRLEKSSYIEKHMDVPIYLHAELQGPRLQQQEQSAGQFNKGVWQNWENLVELWERSTYGGSGEARRPLEPLAEQLI